MEDIASTEPEASMISSRYLGSAFSMVYKSNSSLLSPQLIIRNKALKDRVKFFFILVDSVRFNFSIANKYRSFCLLSYFFLMSN